MVNLVEHSGLRINPYNIGEDGKISIKNGYDIYPVGKTDSQRIDKMLSALSSRRNLDSNTFIGLSTWRRKDSDLIANCIMFASPIDLGFSIPPYFRGEEVSTIPQISQEALNSRDNRLWLPFRYYVEGRRQLELDLGDKRAFNKPDYNPTNLSDLLNKESNLECGDGEIIGHINPRLGRIIFPLDGRLNYDEANELVRGVGNFREMGHPLFSKN